MFGETDLQRDWWHRHLQFTQPPHTDPTTRLSENESVRSLKGPWRIK
jgi:hypothetical protein